MTLLSALFLKVTSTSVAIPFFASITAMKSDFSSTNYAGIVSWRSSSTGRKHWTGRVSNGIGSKTSKDLIGKVPARSKGGGE